MNNLPKPSPKSIIYQDENLYVCLAKYPITKGHTIVVWKGETPDLNLLPDRYYDYLMDTIFATRDALIKTLRVKKVYLVYMDETNHTHWHLVPRYKVKGFDIFQVKPEISKDFSLAEKIKNLESYDRKEIIREARKSVSLFNAENYYKKIIEVYKNRVS